MLVDGLPEIHSIWENKKTKRPARVETSRRWSGGTAFAYRYLTPNPKSRASKMTHRRTAETFANPERFLECFTYLCSAEDAREISTFNGIVQASNRTLHIDSFEAAVAAVKRLQPGTVVGVLDHDARRIGKKPARGLFVAVKEAPGRMRGQSDVRVIVQAMPEEQERLGAMIATWGFSVDDIVALYETRFQPRPQAPETVPTVNKCSMDPEKHKTYCIGNCLRVIAPEKV